MLREVKRPKTGIFADGTPRARNARRVTTELSLADRLSAIRLRFGFGRDRATVAPGLYFAGNPDARSPVLVTANYRLTFDAVRKELDALDVWLLVIDTKGVNVWCAAGKGTFCAEEIERRIVLTGLDRLAPGAPLVLPQLSASGVDALAVADATKRRVVFGPVYARDLGEYLRRDMRKSENMRAVRFALRDRAVLVPVELVHSWFLFPAFASLAAIGAVPGSGSGGVFFSVTWNAAFMDGFAPVLAMLLGSLVAGTIVFPLALPYLPGRFFSFKGCVLAAAWNAAVIAMTRDFFAARPLMAVPPALIGCAVAAYLAMNYTGSSTFTNQRGAEREVEASLPVMAVSACVGALLLIVRCVLSLVGGGIR